MISETTYHGWKALTLTQGDAVLTLPLDIGPRVIAAQLGDGANLFANRLSDLGGTGEPDFRIRGGHRLWHSPEHPQRTYQPDNVAVAVDRLPDDKGVTLKGAIEDATGLRKVVTVELGGDQTFRVTHTLENHGLWPVPCAVWALSVMAHGGFAVLPSMPKVAHGDDLLPNATMIPWQYTDFSLPVWQFHRDYLGVDVAKAEVSQKIGLGNYPGWTAYWQEAGTFVKAAPVDPQATYPDLGSAFELFCCDWMCELETLSHEQVIAPGDSATHVERWGLFADLPKPEDAAAYAQGFAPRVTAWHEGLTW